MKLSMSEEILLLDLALSGRHKGHFLWLLMQAYTAVPLNLRRQAKMLYVWYSTKQGDWDAIHGKNDVIKNMRGISKC